MSDNYYFEPEMNWEELRQYVIKSAPSMVEKGLCIQIKSKDCISIEYLNFYKDGKILHIDSIVPITENRTPAQMKAIIENMFGE